MTNEKYTEKELQEAINLLREIIHNMIGKNYGYDETISNITNFCNTGNYKNLTRKSLDNKPLREKAIEINLYEKINEVIKQENIDAKSFAILLASPLSLDEHIALTDSIGAIANEIKDEKEKNASTDKLMQQLIELNPYFGNHIYSNFTFKDNVITSDIQLDKIILPKGIYIVENHLTDNMHGMLGKIWIPIKYSNKFLKQLQVLNPDAGLIEDVFTNGIITKVPLDELILPNGYYIVENHITSNIHGNVGNVWIPIKSIREHKNTIEPLYDDYTKDEINEVFQTRDMSTTKAFINELKKINPELAATLKPNATYAECENLMVINYPINPDDQTTVYLYSILYNLSVEETKNKMEEVLLNKIVKEYDSIETDFSLDQDSFRI